MRNDTNSNIVMYSRHCVIIVYCDIIILFLIWNVGRYYEKPYCVLIQYCDDGPVIVIVTLLLWEIDIIDSVQQ